MKQVKIQNPQPGPVMPPAPEPEPHTAPRMATVAAETPPKVWRVRETEMKEVYPWLVQRLLDRWPRLNQDGLWVMLRAAIGDRHTIFIRTTDVVGLFDISPGNVLENKPIITERFVRQRGRHMHTKDNEQSVLLYQFVRDYGRQIGTREFNFGLDTDSSLSPHITSGLQDSRIGSEVQRSTCYRVLYTSF